MTSSLVATAGWGPRPESAGDCAARLLRTLRSLPMDSDDAHQWSYIDKGPDSTDSVLPFASTEDDLASIVEAAALRNDRGELMPGAGFTPSFVRQIGGKPRQYSVTCGVDSPYRDNNIALKLPAADESSSLTAPDTLVRTLETLVHGWQPDYATIITHPFRTAQGYKPGPGQIPVGWLTFLASSIKVDRDRLESLAAVREADGGLYLTLPGNPNKPDLAVAVAIRDVLS